MKRVTVRVAALFCVISAATLAAVAVAPVRRLVETVDQNGDGRPDVWRHFDDQGQVTEIDVDSNFDGQADIQEFYQRGALVRRESDRNFNGQADLIEEFDADTHGQTRSVVDIDFDGTADLLVLFQGGRPIYSKRVTSASAAAATAHPIRRTGDGRLAPLVDPFESDTAVRPMRVAPDADVCLVFSTSSGLPSVAYELTGHLAPSATPRATHVSPPASTPLFPRSPRAPPLV